MLRKDYIMRQFEEFGKVLAQILGFKKNQDWEKFQKEIADAAMKFTTLEIDAIEALNETEFDHSVLLNEALGQQQKTILAGLLFEKMNYYQIIGDNDRTIKLKMHCLRLYRHIRENFTDNEFNLDVHYKIGFLEKMED